MSLCINPSCARYNSLSFRSNRCSSCNSSLLLEKRYKVKKMLCDYRLYSTVYLVDDQGTEKVLKVLQTHHHQNPRAVQLFRQQVNILGSLDHPGLPKVDGYFQHHFAHKQKIHCVVMERIDGCNLEEWLIQHKVITEQEIVNWLKQIGEILRFLHQQRYLHRDIRSHNIMRKADGQLVLLDFGTARKVTIPYRTYNIMTGMLYKITPKLTSEDGYIPPEQMRNYCLPQSDFYALGRTMVYLLTGKAPNSPEIYDARTDQLNWRQHAPYISPEVADLIDQLMAPKIGDRPKNAQEILDKITNLSYSL